MTVAFGADPIPGLTGLLWSCTSADLAGFIHQDVHLYGAIHRGLPDCSSHDGFDECSPAWVRQAAPRLLRPIDRLEVIQHWASSGLPFVSSAIDQMVSELLIHLELPESHTLACTALVILLIRGLAAHGSDGRDQR